jgi:hypothetical protein
MLNIDHNKLEAPNAIEYWCYMFSQTKTKWHDLRLPPRFGTTFQGPFVRVDVQVFLDFPLYYAQNPRRAKISKGKCAVTLYLLDCDRF